MNRLFPCLFLLLVCTQICPAQILLSPRSQVVFASQNQGRKILYRNDAFIQRLSPFDCASRLQTSQATRKQYRINARESVLDWSTQETNRLTPTLLSLQARLHHWNLPFPKTIYLIKTTGFEEGEAAYTRGPGIVLPIQKLLNPKIPLESLLAHELFHVLSRYNPKLRDRLYETIGFIKGREITLPEPWRSRQITNPDAPRNQHTITLQWQDHQVWALPVLLSKSPTYDLKQGGKFFDYLELKFLILRPQVPSSIIPSLRTQIKPVFALPSEVSQFHEQIGRNTSYIIHPEEIIADNFMQCVMNNTNVATPILHQKINAILNSF